MDKIRRWIEVGKMMEALKEHAPKKSFLMDDIDMTIYDEVKDLYFRNILHINNAIDETFYLDDDTKNVLYTLADERGVPVDEIVNKALEELSNKCEGHDGNPQYGYYYLKLGEYMEEGDEYSENEKDYFPVFIFPNKLDNILFNRLVIVRRKIKEPQYRLLNYMERVEEGDEWFNTCSQEWIKTVWPFGPVYQLDRTAIYRRLLK